MRDGDLVSGVTRIELGGRDVERIGMRAAGIGIDLQPLLGGEATLYERIYRSGRSAPVRAIIAGLLIDDLAGTAVGAVNAGDVGVAVQVVADPRITLTELTREILHAEEAPRPACIVGAIKALGVRTIVVVGAG